MFKLPFLAFFYSFVLLCRFFLCCFAIILYMNKAIIL
ncbi:hypothetical protein BACOVA_00640 [Bacteroides ovatus ATCC 8483]|uniref:Uncharacterized protein n=1 Tax=Bacteroides ovatus (strain ATCC 8483 / DSM 1896 / JCM 5824 / BCRC 10623 / CCUG 4943 / NCTC 11153) TaxID=411476 RepID=A0AAN3ABV6_BACO1|nr:hypothetical protein BACOVA_00640 [Bacteroides ovatus ATCC 8483]